MFPMYHVNLHKSPKLALKMSTKQRNNVFLHPLPLPPPQKKTFSPSPHRRPLTSQPHPSYHSLPLGAPRSPFQLSLSLSRTAAIRRRGRQRWACRLRSARIGSRAGRRRRLTIHERHAEARARKDRTRPRRSALQDSFDSRGPGRGDGSCVLYTLCYAQLLALGPGPASRSRSLLRPTSPLPPSLPPPPPCHTLQNLLQRPLLLHRQARREAHVVPDDEVSAAAGLARHAEVGVCVAGAGLCRAGLVDREALAVDCRYCALPPRECFL